MKYYATVKMLVEWYRNMKNVRNEIKAEYTKIAI